MSAKNDEAIISVNEGLGTGNSCNVQYRFNQKESSLFNGESAEKCHKKAEQTVEMHRDRWGWDCSLLSAFNVPEPTEALEDQLPTAIKNELNEYEKASLVTAMIATASPLRMMIREYEMMQGEKPTSLKDLRMDRKDMNDSRHLRDLTIDAEGSIVILGPESLGNNVIVRLKEVQTLGGMNSEMRCEINIQVKRVDYCEFEPMLRFPG